MYILHGNIKRADTIRGNEKITLIIDMVKISDLAARHEPQIGAVGVIERTVHGVVDLGEEPAALRVTATLTIWLSKSTREGRHGRRY